MMSLFLLSLLFLLFLLVLFLLLLGFCFCVSFNRGLSESSMSGLSLSSKRPQSHGNRSSYKSRKASNIMIQVLIAMISTIITVVILILLIISESSSSSSPSFLAPMSERVDPVLPFSTKQYHHLRNGYIHDKCDLKTWQTSIAGIAKMKEQKAADPSILRKKCQIQVTLVSGILHFRQLHCILRTARRTNNVN